MNDVPVSETQKKTLDDIRSRFLQATDNTTRSQLLADLEAQIGAI